MKIRIMLLFIVLFIYIPILNILCISTASSNQRIDTSEYIYVNFNDFLTSYNANKINLITSKYDDKIIDITGNTTAVYLNPEEKYASFVEFRTSKRNVDTFNKIFLLKWFKLVNSQTTYLDENTAQGILAEGNFDALYTSYLFSSKGRTYYVITQKVLGNIMEKDVENGETIKIYFWNLGQYQDNTPVLVIVGYEKVSEIQKDIKDKIFFREYLPNLKSNILNRKYDKAKGNIKMLLKKYPNNIDLKLSLCLIFKETNFFSKSIACYNDIIRKNPDNYDAYYGLASAYYNNPNSSLRSKAQIIIQNSTKALELIESSSDNTVGSLALIKYKSYFLRAMAKIALNDKSAIKDLEKINNEQPIIVSDESLRLYKEELGIK